MLVWERGLVALGVLASFTIIVVTGHLNIETSALLGPLLGAIAVAWYGGHSAQVQQQPQAPAALPTAEAPPTKGVTGA